MNPDVPATTTTTEAEPVSTYATVPMWLFVTVFVLLCLGAVYFDARGGWFDARVYGPYHTAPADFQPPRGDGPDLEHGRRVYNMACSACHQTTGLGSTANNAPPLLASEWVLAEGPNRIIRIVLNGLQGPIEVAGKPYGAGVMTPFKDSLSDADIAAVITFIRMNPEWNHKGTEVKPEQVAKIREETKTRAVNWTAAELLKVPESD
jgi:mono/diheme cytochrome c family protein